MKELIYKTFLHHGGSWLKSGYVQILRDSEVEDWNLKSGWLSRWAGLEISGQVVGMTGLGDQLVFCSHQQEIFIYSSENMEVVGRLTIAELARSLESNEFELLLGDEVLRHVRNAIPTLSQGLLAIQVPPPIATGGFFGNYIALPRGDVMRVLGDAFCQTTRALQLYPQGIHLRSVNIIGDYLSLEFSPRL